MKRMIAILSSLFLLIACVPTPTEEFVANKSDGRLEAAITETTPVPAYQTQGTAEPSEPTGTEPVETLKSMLGVPDRVQESFSGKVFGGSIMVTIDAAPHIPDVSTVPVDEIAIRTYAPEDAERIARMLLGSGPYYLYDFDRAQRDVFSARIKRIPLHIEAFQNKVYGDGFAYYDDMIAQEQMYLENDISILNSIPEPGPMQLWTGSFSDAQFDLANAGNDRLRYAHGTFGFETHAEPPKDTEFDLDKQIADAALLLNAFGNAATAEYTYGEHNDESLRKQYHTAHGIDDDELEATFLPLYHGIPAYDYTTYCGTDTAKDAAGVNTAYSPTYPMERILVNFSNGTIAHLQWDSPTETVATVNENVALLSFEQIMQTFRTQILYHHYLDPARHGAPDPVYSMVITDILFSYLRVKRQDTDTYYLIPVWDFMGYGYDDVFPDDPNSRGWYAHQSFLTINAIDGSIIDRNVGY